MTSTLPSDEEILKKTYLLNGVIDTTLASKRKTNKVTVRDKLRLLNEELIRFKTSGVSFKVIRGLLAEQVGLHVSEQTLREHCQQELGFKKRAKSSSSETCNSGKLNDHCSNDALFTQDQPQVTPSLHGLIAPSSEQEQNKVAVRDTEIETTLPPAKPVNNPTVSNTIQQQTTELLDQLEDF